MPIAQMKTNYPLDSTQKTAFLSEMAEKMAEVLHKPLPAVMVILDDCAVSMNETEDTAFFSEFRYVMPNDVNGDKNKFLKEFADDMLSVIQKYTHVNPYRIYMQFTEMDRVSAWRYTEPQNASGRSERI